MGPERRQTSYPEIPAGKKPAWFCMPAYPPPTLDPLEEDTYFESLREFLITQGESEKETNDFLEPIVLSGPHTPACKNFRKKIFPRAMVIGFYIMHLQARYQNYKVDRDTALNLIGKKYFAPKMGNPLIPDIERRKILRESYKEMSQAIREIKHRLSMSSQEESLEFIYKDNPGIEDIFTADEVHLILQPTQVRDTCLHIMYNRLLPVMNRNKFSKRTLKDMLSRTKNLI